MQRDQSGETEGHPTRGKTARNRLRRLDLYLTVFERTLLTRGDEPFHQALFVDLGYGALPFTTLESASRLRRVNPQLKVLGVEIDPDRVERAKAYANEFVNFRCGGFQLPLYSGTPKREHVRLIRAMNVLRQYDEADVVPAYRAMGRSLLPGGLLVEGTSNPSGRVWVVNLLRRDEHQPRLVLEAILFGTNFRDGFNPEMFQPVLPKRFIHRMVSGEPIHSFFEQWKTAWRKTMSMRVFGPRQWYIAAAKALHLKNPDVDIQPKLLKWGMLRVHTSAGMDPIPLDIDEVCLDP